MRLTRVGAMKVLVQRWVWIRWSASSGSNFCMTTTRPPKSWVVLAKEPGAE